MPAECRSPESVLQRHGARVRRAAINEGVFMSIPMSVHLEMGVVREGGASLNRSGVECGIWKAMRNSVCRGVLQSGAALKAIVRGESARSDRR